jgi:ribose 5-phosphate isomerase B
MKVVIASDFSGFRLKESVKAHVISLGYDVADVGAQKESDTTLYYEAAGAAAQMIQSGEADRGIVICGTGAGVSMIANKYRGVYAVACESVYTAEKTSLINNANVLAMGEKVVSYAMGAEMAEKWLAGKWCEGFETQRRLNNERGYAKLKELEDKF